MTTKQTLDRRKFLARAGAAAAGVAATPLLNLADLAGAESPRPNVLILLADGTGWNDVGYNGSEIRTPHIDRLASEGVRLDQYYVYPTCSPSRVALLSGRPPSRWGILGPIAGKSTLALPPETVTLPRILSRAGYETAITGKWHLGLRPEFGPWKYGFDHTYGSLHGQVDQYTHHYKFGDVTWHREGTFTEEEGHATDLIANEAVEFLRSKRDKDRPFFLYVPFTVPHYPLQEPETWTAPYNDAIENESRRLYAASMTHMDDAVGKILAALEVEGIEENTLVIFRATTAARNNGRAERTNTTAGTDRTTSWEITGRFVGGMGASTREASAYLRPCGGWVISPRVFLTNR